MRHRPDRKRTVKWKISLPFDLAARVELRLPINSGQACPAYGVRSTLIEGLLEDWLNSDEHPVVPAEAIAEGEGPKAARVDGRITINYANE